MQDYLYIFEKMDFLVVERFEFLQSRFLAKPAMKAKNKNKCKIEHYQFFSSEKKFK